MPKKSGHQQHNSIAQVFVFETSSLFKDDRCHILIGFFGGVGLDFFGVSLSVVFVFSFECMPKSIS